MSNTTAVNRPSDRKFGITVTIALSVVGIWGALRNWGWVWCAVALTASVIVGAVTLAAPSTLAPLNRGWFYVGETMGKIVSPVFLGIIFFGLLTPITIITRSFGRDELRLRRRGASTYWIRRDPPNSTAQSFRNQF